MNTFASPERILLDRSTHWMKYCAHAVSHVFLTCLGIGLLYIAQLMLPRMPFLSSVIFLLALLLITVTHHRFFHILLSENMPDILLTNERVVYFDDYLFLRDDEQEIPLEKIASVEVKQRGIFQNILDYGSLVFDTGGSTPGLARTISLVPKPDALARHIQDAIDQREQNPASDTTQAQSDSFSLH